MIKKILTTLTIVISLCLPILSFIPAYADDNNTTNLNKPNNGLDFSVAECPTFFGLKAWYCGINLDDINSEEVLREDIVLIIVNIVEDVFILAGYTLLCFIIYGGFMYLISSGDAGKVATGKKIITRSIVGIIIIASAYIILNTLRVILLGNEHKFEDCASDVCMTPESLIGNALSWLYGIIAVIAVIFIIYAGISYMTSAGDSGKLAKAKQTILYAIIGLVIVALAYAITNFVINLANDNQAPADSNSSTTSILLEEPHEIRLS